MHSIKDGVKDIILKAPIWSLYIRRDMRLPCECHNSVYNSPSYFCTKCLGTGYKIKIEKIPVRVSLNMRELKGEDDITVLGRIDQAQPRIYTTAATAPKDNDLIVHVMWNKSGDKKDALPTAVLRVYSLQISFPQMQSDISFYSVGLNPYHLTQEFIDGLREHPLYIGKY